MAKLQTAVLVFMFCLMLEKSSWVSGSSEVKRNHGSNDVQVVGLREKRATTCRDYYSYQWCYWYWSRGQCNQNVPRSYCQKTCRYCTTQPSVPKPTAPKPTSCRNTKTKSQCENWVKLRYCTDARYRVWMKANCALSCGYCLCKNSHNSCGYWARNGECQKNPNYMLLNCQKSCVVCRPKTTTKPITKPKPKPTPKPTKKPTPKPTTVATTIPTTSPTTVSAGRTCGHSLTAGSRIVGGIFAQPGKWPWHAGIRSCLNCTTLPFCGGTLINNDWVVTAAHCVAGVLASQTYVILGETNFLHKSRHEIIREVQAIYSHPDYAIAARFDYDIALLKLTSSVKFTHYIQPACLPHLNPKLPAGLNCTVTGFGRTTERGVKSPRLKQAKVPLVSQAQCKKVVGDTGSLRITPNMFCAGHAKGGIDACQGDSGGPLVCKSSDGSYELAGVVSWGKGCARANQYGVYADMQVLRGWVENVIAGQL